MKTRIRVIKVASVAAALIVGGWGTAQAVEADTNATTVAYWKLGGADSVSLSPGSVGILDLATNTGQGTVAGTVSGVPLSVQDLWFQGPLAGSPTFVANVPPAAMFNANNYFNSGAASWDCGADQFPSTTGSLVCDNATYGNSFNGPDFTFEIYFKSDTTNDPTTGTQTQVLIFDHHNSAYAFLYLNADTGDTNNIGSLRFWSYNVAIFGIDCRITAAMNHGHRLDDGQWHYAAARFNATTETMNLLVVNQDGTSAETTSYTTLPLNPGGSGSQGPLYLGCDEGQNQPFDGLINQIRYSNVSLPNSGLLANAATCNAPVFNNTASTNAVAVGAVLSVSPAAWPAHVQGGPLLFQWQENGTNIVGQTNLNLNLFPATLDSAGSYQLIAATPCGGVTATSAPVVVTVAQAIPLTRWGFNFTEAVTFPQATVDDLLPGQNYDLITFNDAPNPSGIGGNGGIGLTNTVPPTGMFINGNNGGTNAFEPSFIQAVNGVVFYPNNSGGPIFDFQGSFSLEVFFKTYGDQSATGPMSILAQGSDGGNTIRYSLNLNQAGAGAINFNINNFAVAPTGPSFEDTNAGIQSVSIKNQNYADGNWHYLLAQYDAGANKITLSVANLDNTGTNATLSLPVGYSPLGAQNTGNLFVGRYRYPLNDGGITDPRTFIGAIDEVQISAGLITPDTGRLGFLAGIVTPHITGISISNSTVTITFTGSAADSPSAFTLVGSSTVNGTYSNLSATVTSLGSGNFQVSVGKNGAAQFYRIKR